MHLDGGEVSLLNVGHKQDEVLFPTIDEQLTVLQYAP